MTGNALNSLNFSNMQHYGIGNAISGSFTPADMGLGLFNMPVMPTTTLNTDNLFNPANLTQFFNPKNDSYALNNNMDWGKVLTELSKIQNQYIASLMASFGTFNTNINNQSNITNNQSGGYGNNNSDVTQKYMGNASDLDKNLQGVLSGKGAKLLELQEKYGISASFLAALVNTESAHGKSNAARNKNNVAGIMSKESGYMKLASFNSVDDCLEALASNLSRNYVGKGLTTVSQIHKKYCPIGANNDPTGMNNNWGSTVSQLKSKYDSQGSNSNLVG